MAEPFLGEIHMFAGDFAIDKYAMCDGQYLGVRQNQALFSLLGNTFGGDGRKTFCLPDMKARVPVGLGQGRGLPYYFNGQTFGEETAQVTEEELPSHNHPWYGTQVDAEEGNPEDRLPAKTSGFPIYAQPKMKGQTVAMDRKALSSCGYIDRHHNLMPYICINFMISLHGTYPPRT
jgi:microcystin-dependent protein